MHGFIVELALGIGKVTMRTSLLLFAITANAFVLYMPAQSGYWLAAALAIVSVTVALMSRVYRRRARRFHKVALFALLLAVFIASVEWRLSSRIAAQLPRSLEGNTLSARGRIVGSPERDGDYLRFLFAPQRVAAAGYPLSKGLWRLSWKDAATLNAHTEIEVEVQLKRPRGFVNPRAFDYQLWLLSQNIVATGWVKSLQAQEPIREAAYDMRAPLLKAVDDAAARLRHPELLRALLLGDKSGITQAQWQRFQNTGTVHLMAISGLHIGMLAACVLFGVRALLRLAWRRLSLWSQYLISYLSACTAALVYAYLAGFSVPTQRAVLCLLLLCLMQLLRRNTNYLHIVLSVAVIVLICDPWALSQPGFALSFGAVATLIYGFSARPGRAARAYVFAKAQWVLLIGLLPFMAVFGLPVALIAPLANALALPLFSVLILPLILLGGVAALTGLDGFWPWRVADTLLAALMRALRSLDHVWSAQLWWRLEAFWDPVLLFLACMCLLSPRAFALRMPGGLLLAILWFAQSQSKPGLHLAVLDVGQGLAVIARIRDAAGADYRLVYDLGAQFSPSFDTASRVLVPALQQQGIRALDALVISHADNDHAGAYPTFLQRFSTQQRLASKPDSLDKSQLKFASCAGATLMQTDSARIDVLWPRPDTPVETLSDNDASCVLLITWRDRKILLTGDISSKVERQLLAVESIRDIDVLIAPHHGSASSSSWTFLQHIRPRHVVFSTGYRNRYRHPSAKIVPRYEALGSQIWNTAWHGALVFDESETELRVTSARCNQPRRWYLAEGYCATGDE